ncbi:MAG TPA: membrane dipeptidase [Chthoniobacteraceae bacterium]|jgi:membrane dipeptidase|nr:membrane dipeptidase [Chthoniobacteraceae bacterium]
MNRRTFIAQGGAALALTGAARAAGETEEKARALHRETGVFDAYTKPLLKLTQAGFEPGRFIEQTNSQAGLWRLREGHVRMANMSVGVPRYHRPASPDGKSPTSMPICALDEEPRMVLRQLDALSRSAELQPRELGLARTVAEAEKLNADGRLALFLHLTGAWIADDLAVLRMYHEMGVVAIHPCIEGHHRMGDSANEVRLHGGLTPLGRAVVAEMNRRRMVVDVAHGSDESIRDMVETSSAPVIYSHGGCKALCDNPRNLTDERIKQIAAKGGVVGIAFVSAMLSNEARAKGGRADPRYAEEYARADSELHEQAKDPYAYLEKRADGTFMPGVYRRLGWPEEGGLGAAPANRAQVDNVVDHLEHIAKLVGIEHAAIGTDYESGDVPNGLEHAGKMPNLTAALLRRGFSEADVRKILSGNLKRIYRQVLDQPGARGTSP